LLPCFEKIQIRESDDLDELFQQTITTISHSIVFHCNREDIEPPKRVKEILEYFLSLRFKSGGEGYSIGISVLGTGGQFGKSTSASTPNVLRNARVHLKTLIDVVINELKFSGVFVVINNLDILSKDKLIHFVNMARDELFDLDGIYWTLIGRKGMGTVIESAAPRVAHYLSGTESYLEPLSFEQTKMIIDERVKRFANGSGARCPLSDGVIRTFHFMSMRETRETFRICGEVVKRVLLINPTHRIIPDDIALNAFLEYASERVKDLELTDSARRILSAVHEKTSCRPKDFENFGYSTSQGFIAALKGLESKRLLAVEERGKARIYRMTGAAVIASVTGALGEDLRKAVIRHLREGAQQSSDRDDEFSQAQLNLELDEY